MTWWYSIYKQASKSVSPGFNFLVYSVNHHFKPWKRPVSLQFPFIVDFRSAGYRRNVVSCDANSSTHCTLLTMSSSIFGAERRSSEPISALAVLSGRHREKKHPRPCFSQKSTRQRNQRDNDRETGLSIRDLLITLVSWISGRCSTNRLDNCLSDSGKLTDARSGEPLIRLRSRSFARYVVSHRHLLRARRE